MDRESYTSTIQKVLTNLNIIYFKFVSVQISTSEILSSLILL